MYINKLTEKVYTRLPRNFRDDNGGLIANFDQLDDNVLIDRFGIYPLIDSTVLSAYQSKTTPVYSFSATNATVSYTITELSLAEKQGQLISSAYSQAASLLDAHSEGYSVAEMASWPALRAEVKAYNADNSVVGSAMQEVIDQGLHDTVSLSALLTPRVTYYDAVIAARNTHVVAIKSATDITIDAVDVTTGWPV